MQKSSTKYEQTNPIMYKKKYSMIHWILSHYAHHIKRLCDQKENTHMIISIEAGKASDKTQYSWGKKNSQQTRNRKELPQFGNEYL